MKKSKALLKGLGAVAATAGLGVLAAGEIMWFTTLTNKGNKLGQKFMAKNEEFQNQFVCDAIVQAEPEPTLYETTDFKGISTLNSLGEIANATFSRTLRRTSGLSSATAILPTLQVWSVTQGSTTKRASTSLCPICVATKRVYAPTVTPPTQWAGWTELTCSAGLTFA